MQPLAGLILALCVALLTFGATAAADSSQPVATSAALRTAVIARVTVDKMLASSSKALKACLREHPEGCKADRRAVNRTRAQLTSLDGRIARYSRHHGGSKTKGATNPSAPTSSDPVTSPTETGSTSAPKSESPTGTGSGSGPGSAGGSTGGSGSTSDPTTPVETVPPPVQEELQPRLPGSVVLGLVGGSGWGPEVAKKVIAAGFKSERLEAGSPWTTDKESYENGFRNDQVIVGNTPDETKLSAINTASWVSTALAQVKEAVSFNYTLLEVGNEMYSKGGQAEPVKYAEMYMALANAVDAAGIKGVTLIFDSFGDYQEATGQISEISSDGGWLADALRAQPTLKGRVQAFSAHPYGIPGVKYDGHDWGIEGLEAEHSDAVALGFEHTDYYATEYGEEDQAPGAANQQQQAERIKWAYEQLLSLPYLRGIWYYQLHDDGAGHWGLVSGTWEPRPALAIVEGFLHNTL
jgi:hypothetical protein